MEFFVDFSPVGPNNLLGRLTAKIESKSNSLATDATEPTIICPHVESNHDRKIRNLAFYPLNYEGCFYSTFICVQSA